MHPVLKRILLNGGVCAGLLALIGVVFMELSGVLALGGTARPGSADLNPQLPDSLRYRVPLTMAGAGFLFVAACELVMWRLRGNKPPAVKPAEPQPDAEKLLNELLAQAEAKMAAEQRGQEQKAEGGEQKTESESKPHAPA